MDSDWVGRVALSSVMRQVQVEQPATEAPQLGRDRGRDNAIVQVREEQETRASVGARQESALERCSE